LPTESKIFFLLLALFFTKNPGFLRGYSFGTQKVVGRLTEYDFSGNSFFNVSLRQLSSPAEALAKAGFIPLSTETSTGRV